MKKTIGILITMTMVLALCGCNQQPAHSQTGKERLATMEESTANDSETEQTESNPEETEVTTSQATQVEAPKETLGTVETTAETEEISETTETSQTTKTRNDVTDEAPVVTEPKEKKTVATIEEIVITEPKEKQVEHKVQATAPVESEAEATTAQVAETTVEEPAEQVPTSTEKPSQAQVRPDDDVPVFYEDIPSEPEASAQETGTQETGTQETSAPKMSEAETSNTSIHVEEPAETSQAIHTEEEESHPSSEGTNSTPTSHETTGSETVNSHETGTSSGTTIQPQSATVSSEAMMVLPGRANISQSGENSYYLLNSNGSMIVSGLVQDNTGNFYSIESANNGYFGMLRYQDGYYNCDGQVVYLTFNREHNGSFGAITNADGIEKLKSIYGIAISGIGHENSVYTSSF
ncbi:MAG: hypothetical protein KBT07_01435 [Clostridiales bacterium]|nr:hypothetical protein [Candidatus Scatonaster coprocaballi]